MSMIYNVPKNHSVKPIPPTARAAFIDPTFADIQHLEKVKQCPTCAGTLLGIPKEVGAEEIGRIKKTYFSKMKNMHHQKGAFDFVSYGAYSRDSLEEKKRKMEIAYEAVASGGIVHIISDPNKELFELLGEYSKKSLVEVFAIYKTRADSLLFLFQITKTSVLTGLYAHFTSLIGWNPSMTKAYENVEAEKMDAEMLWSRVEEVVRYRELGKQLYKIAPWSGKPCLQFDIEMPGSGNKYTITVWDAARPDRKEESWMVKNILVPNGSANAYCYTDPQTVKTLVDETKGDRLVMIVRQDTIPDSQAKKDVDNMISLCVPLEKAAISNIYPVKESSSRREIANIQMQSSMAIVEESMSKMGHVKRSLLLSSNIGRVHATVDVDYGKDMSNPEQGRIHYKYTSLLLPHQLMVATMDKFKPMKEAPSILGFGLRGGTMYAKLKALYPNAQITVVERESALVSIARTYFQLPEDVEVILGETMEVLEKMAEEGTRKFDYVFVDVDNDDQEHVIRSPPHQFCLPANMEKVKNLVADLGVLEINLGAKSKPVFNACHHQISKGWATTESCEIGDTQEIIVMTNRRN